MSKIEAVFIVFLFVIWCIVASHIVNSIDEKEEIMFCNPPCESCLEFLVSTEKDENDDTHQQE